MLRIEKPCPAVSHSNLHHSCKIYLLSPLDTYPTLSNESCFIGRNLSQGAEDFRLRDGAGWDIFMCDLIYCSCMQFVPIVTVTLRWRAERLPTQPSRVCLTRAFLPTHTMIGKSQRAPACTRLLRKCWLEEINSPCRLTQYHIEMCQDFLILVYEIRVHARSDYPPRPSFNMLDTNCWYFRKMKRSKTTLLSIEKLTWEIRQTPLLATQRLTTIWENHRGIPWSHGKIYNTGSRTTNTSIQATEKLRTHMLGPFSQCFIGTMSQSISGPISCRGCCAYRSVPFFTAFSNHDTSLHPLSTYMWWAASL